MSKCYCEECKGVFDYDNAFKGETVSEDMYYLDLCPECRSESIGEVTDEKNICPECGLYHEDRDDWRNCFHSLYTDARGILYINTKWAMEDIIEIMSALSDSGKNDTLEEIIWDSDDGGKDFVRFACEYDDAVSDIWRNYKLLNEIPA